MNPTIAALWATLRRWRSRRPNPFPRSVGSRRNILEPLEARLALAADLSFAPIQDQTVLGGAPLWLGIDGLDSGDGSLNYTVSVSNSDLLTASLSPASNSSLQMDVANFGQMTFQLFDHLAPETTAHIKSLVERGDFNSDPLLPVKWYRIANFVNNEGFVIQGGPQYNAGASPLGPFDDEYHLDLQFTSGGLLGMGKSNDDTNDASIFVTAAPSRFLDFNHTIFGVLTEGDAVRRAIQLARPSGDGPPPNDIVITSSRIIADTQNAALMLKSAEGASGESDVTLSVTDAEGHVFSQTFQVTVAPDTANSAPFLADTPETITVESGLAISLFLHAIDAEGDPSFFDAARPGFETVPYALDVNHDTGQVSIVPPEGFTGRFQVQVGVRGAQATTTADQFDTQIIEVIVGEPGDPGEPGNRPPVAVDDAAFAYSSPGTFFIDVKANDTTAPDEDESLTIVSVSTPESGGSTTTYGSLVVYTPGAGFTGTDHFTYTISDGRGGTATATVTVTVNSAPTDSPQVGLILQLTTEGGAPLTSLAPGQDFVLHVLTQDQSRPPQGVYAAYLDIQWDASLAAVTGPIRYSSIYANGVFGEASAGLIDEAGAFAGLPNLGGGIYEVFSVPMQATAAGTLEFTSNPADFTPVTDVLIYGRNGAVPASQVHYGTVAITVDERSPLDINGDGFVTPLDALIVINAINDRFASGIRDGSLPDENDGPRLDVSRDGFLTPVDALIIINDLNGLTTLEVDQAVSAIPGEGEGSSGPPADQYLLALAADEFCLGLTSRGRLRKS